MGQIRAELVSTIALFVSVNAIYYRHLKNFVWFILVFELKSLVVQLLK